MVNTDTNIILNSLYPIVEESLNKNSRKFMNNIAKFVNDRHEELFDIAPYVRIYFNPNDVQNIFTSLELTEEQVKNIMKDCYFWDMDISPLAAKEPYVQVLMCCVRYFLKHSRTKEAENTVMFILFTGKFYASLHTMFWKHGVNKAVMDYVINNMLSDKFDLKKEGSLIKSMIKLGKTWIDKYKVKITAKPSDDMFKLLVQQLRDRERSFLKNIANLYYEAIDNKLYLNYETDSINPEEFRITTNDSAYAARLTEAAMNILTSRRVSIDYCNICKSDLIKPLELKEILEAIFGNKDNLPKLRRVLNIIICNYMAENPGKKIGGNDDFIIYTITPKPNTKNPLILELKATVSQWLTETSERYRRSNRPATINAFYISVLHYIAIIITSCAVK